MHAFGLISFGVPFRGVGSDYYRSIKIDCASATAFFLFFVVVHWMQSGGISGHCSRVNMGAAMKIMELARLAYGLLELTVPSAISGGLAGEKPDAGARKVIRILGARHIVQALATIGRGSPWHSVGGLVDLLHASSAVVFAIIQPRWRRTASLSAAVSVAFASGELR